MPLSPSAVRLILEAIELSKDPEEPCNDKPVFGSHFESVVTLSRHSLSEADRRIEQRVCTFTPHDLRRTAATFAQSPRIQRDYVKALVNHQN